MSSSLASEWRMLLQQARRLAPEAKNARAMLALNSRHMVSDSTSKVNKDDREKNEASSSAQGDDESYVDRIMDAGSKRLFDSEEGREKLREGTYDIDTTATTMLEAAQQALGEEGREAGAEGEKGADARRAGDAAESIKKGKDDSVAHRVKEKVVGIGQTS